MHSQFHPSVRHLISTSDRNADNTYSEEEFMELMFAAEVRPFYIKL